MSVFVHDIFSGGVLVMPGTLITARTGLTGASWTVHPIFNNTVQHHAALTGTGYAYLLAGSYGTRLVLLASGVPSGTEFDVRSNVLHTDTALSGPDGEMGLVWNANPTDASMYRLVYGTYENKYFLGKYINGTYTPLGSYLVPGGVAGGTTYLLQVKVRNTSPRIEVLMGNTSIITSDDNEATGGNRAGLHVWGSGGSGHGESGYIFDDFIVGSAGFTLPIYSVGGPAGGPPDFDSDVFTVSLFDGVNPGSITITPGVTGVTGSFTPASVTLTNASRSATFTFRPGVTPGTGTISFTNNTGASNEAPKTYTSVYAPPARLDYWHTTIGQRADGGPIPFVAYKTNPDGTGGYWFDGTGHYDPQGGYYKLEDYCIAKGLPYAFTSVKQQAMMEVRDRGLIGFGRPGIAYNGQLNPGENEPDSRETPGTQDYHRYISGPARHYLETGDPLDLMVAGYMAGDAVYPGTLGLWWDPNEITTGNQREIAFLLQAFLDRLEMGLGEHSATDKAARIILGQITLWTTPYATKPYGVHLKPWMGGLACRALIGYWERFRSSVVAEKVSICGLIPAAVKSMAAYLLTPYCWYPVGFSETVFGQAWDKGAVAYRDFEENEPKITEITGLAVTAVGSPSNRIFRGPNSLSSVDGYYKGAGVAINGIDDGYLIRSYTGSTREFALSEYYYVQRPITTSDTFKIYPTGWAPDENRAPTPHLNHLTFPVFAWCYWHERRILGNYEASKHFRTEAHMVFNGCEHSWQMPYSQKNYNQSSVWTTDGLYWLEQGDSEYPDTSTFTFQTPARGVKARAGKTSGVFKVSIPYGSKVATPKVITPSGGAGTYSNLPIIGTHHRRGGFSYTPTVGEVGSTVQVSASGSGVTPGTGPHGLTIQAALSRSVAVTRAVFSGPRQGDVNVTPHYQDLTKRFVVTLEAGTFTGTVRFTPQASSGTGTFYPSYVDLDEENRSKSFRYVPTSAGARTISVTNDRGLTNPPAVDFQTAAYTPGTAISSYTVTGPATGPVYTDSAPFTVTLGSGEVDGTWRFMPYPDAVHDGLGEFYPPYVDLTEKTRSATFVYHPYTEGAQSFSFPGVPTLTGPVTSYTVTGEAEEPDPAVTAFTLSGPSSGAVGAASSNFTVMLGDGVVTGTIRFTPGASSGSGTFSPTFLDLTDSVRSGTFTFTPSTAGARTISVTENGGLEPTSGIVYTATAVSNGVTGYTLTGPSGGLVNQSSSAFLLTLGSGTVVGTIRFTPQASTGTGIFSPAFLDLTNSVRSGVFTYIPSSLGTRYVTASDNANLADPSPLPYTVTAPDSASVGVEHIYVSPDSVGFVITSRGRTWIIPYLPGS